MASDFTRPPISNKLSVLPDYPTQPIPLDHVIQPSKPTPPVNMILQRLYKGNYGGLMVNFKIRKFMHVE